MKITITNLTINFNVTLPSEPQGQVHAYPTPVDTTPTPEPYNGGVYPDELCVGDEVRYTRKDGSSIKGMVVSTTGSFEDNDLVILIKKDNGKVTKISAIGPDMSGRFGFIDTSPDC